MSKAKESEGLSILIVAPVKTTQAQQSDQKSVHHGLGIPLDGFFGVKIKPVSSGLIKQG